MKRDGSVVFEYLPTLIYMCFKGKQLNPLLFTNKFAQQNKVLYARSFNCNI